MDSLDKILFEMDTEPFSDVAEVYSRYHVAVHLTKWKFLEKDIQRDFNKVIRKNNYSKFIVGLVKVTYRQLKAESQEVSVYD